MVNYSADHDSFESVSLSLFKTKNGEDYGCIVNRGSPRRRILRVIPKQYYESGLAGPAF